MWGCELLYFCSEVDLVLISPSKMLLRHTLAHHEALEPRGVAAIHVALEGSGATECPLLRHTLAHHEDLEGSSKLPRRMQCEASEPDVQSIQNVKA